MRWAWVLPGLGLLLSCVGCDRARQSGRTDSQRGAIGTDIRLLDLRDRMRLRSSETSASEVYRVSFSEAPERSLLVGRRAMAALVGEESEPEPEPLPLPLSAPAYRREGLSLPAPGLFLHAFAAPRASAVEVEVQGDMDPSAELYLIPMDRAMAARPLDDPEVLAAIMRVRIGGDPFRLRVDASGGAGRTVFPSRLSVAYLLVALAREAPITLSELRVRRCSAYDSLLLRPTTQVGAEDVRRVSVHRDHREALLLRAPAEAVIPLDRWDMRSKISLFLAGLDPGRSIDFVVSVFSVDAETGERVTAPLSRVESAWTPAAAGWLRVEVPFPESQSGELVVTAEVRDPDGETVTIAVGTPRRHPEPGSSHPVGGSGPDVILISLDTVRADRLPPSPESRRIAPEITRLAERAVVFSNAVSPAPWTLPAHASIFTGQYPQRHQASGERRRLGGEAPNLTRTLRAAGYATQAYTGGGYVGPDFGLANGFERYSTVDIMTTNPNDRALALTRRDELLEELAAPRTGPRFYFIHTYIAHNYGPSTEALLAVGGSPDQLRLLDAELLRLSLEERIRKVEGPWGRDPNHAALLRLVYDAGVWSADRLVGDVVDAVDDAGRWDNTVLIVLSDHGEELQDRGRVGHGHGLHGELLHVPLVIHAPGSPPAEIDAITSLVDVAPTVLALVGLGWGPGVDGRSLVPILTGGRLSPRAVVAETRWGGVLQALQSRSLKLIVSEGGEEAPRLFEVLSDPDERLDIGLEKSRLADRLHTQLRRRLVLLRAGAEASEAADLDPDLEAELRELGYLGGG